MNKEFYDFVCSWNLIDSSKLSTHSRIEADLGLTGDDAFDFIQEFSELFNVDISSLDCREYFIPEGVSRYWYNDNNRPKDMTLGKLNDAVVSRKLT